MEQILKAFYDLYDDLAPNPDWQRKLEEDVGQQIAFLAISIDESSRDLVVENSPYFARFVTLFPLTCRTKKSKSISNERVLGPRHEGEQSTSALLPVFNWTTVKLRCLNKQSQAREASSLWTCRGSKDFSLCPLRRVPSRSRALTSVCCSLDRT